MIIYDNLGDEKLFRRLGYILADGNIYLVDGTKFQKKYKKKNFWRDNCRLNILNLGDGKIYSVD